MTVALNTTLTEELIAEGVERELVSKIQAMRKEADFQITDRIAVYYQADGRARAVLQAGAFAEDVLAVAVVEGDADSLKKIVDLNVVDGDDIKDADGVTKMVDVNGEKVTLTIVKA